MTSKTVTYQELWWELPLAFISFLFFKVMKFIIGNLYNFRLSHHDQQHLEWQPLSTETLKSPITVPFWMTFGPRLNTHAIIAPVGPFDVKETVEFNVEAAEQSAKSWTMVVYRFPDYKTVLRIGSGGNSLQEKWESISLEPGKYMLGLRYYQWPDQVKFPDVKVDGQHLIQSKIISGDVNTFYRDLRTRENWFYFSLHFYIFPLLRLRKWLPESFVKKEFLPVGDPALTYYYGCFKSGEQITVTLNPDLLKHYDVYVTLYDRASFVISFHQIDETNAVISPTEVDGFYLFRIREKPTCQSKINADWININLCSSLDKLN